MAKKNNTQATANNQATANVQAPKTRAQRRVAALQEQPQEQPQEQQQGGDILADAATEFQPKRKAANTDLSAWIEKSDKESDRAQIRDLFRDMLLVQRGYGANLALFKSFRTDPRMQALLREKGFKCSAADLTTVFSGSWIADELDTEHGGYRKNSRNTICQVYLPRTVENVAEAELNCWEKVPQSENDKKHGYQRYLKPMAVFTFHQFAQVAKIAVENYRRRKQAEQLKKAEEPTQAQE